MSGHGWRPFHNQPSSFSFAIALPLTPYTPCRDLRTNLPREVMGYADAPFTPDYMGAASRDPRRYPGHAEVSGGVHCLKVFMNMSPACVHGNHHQ
jgi:hypothetical protein